MPQLEELFQEPNEKLLAVLGEEEAERYRRGEPVQTSLLVLSDKRLYHRGRFYKVRSGSRAGQLRPGGFSLPVSDLGPSLLRKQEVSWNLVLGLIYITLGLYFGIRAVFDSDGVITQNEVLSLFLAVMVITFGVFDIRKYIRNRGVELYVLVTRRGGLGVNIAWHKPEEIELFREKLISVVGPEYGH